MPTAAVDHCTLWLEGTWAQCCAAHDAAYADPAILRSLADHDLATCVAGTSALGAAVCGLMWVAVRVCGWWFRRRALLKGKD